MAYFYALLSAIFAALVAILAKLGLKNVDPTFATAIRSVVMTLFFLITTIYLSKFNNFSFSNLGHREWILIVLSGLAGAISWLFYFWAIKMGNVSAIAAIDRTSLVFVVILSVLVLGETLTWKMIFGVLFMLTGALLLTF